MFGWLRHWKPIGGGMIIIALLGSYPATMVLSHKLPDQIADNSRDEVWADQRIGAAIELIQTEFEVRHWSDALPEWHPQNQLIAVPAFQDGLRETLALFAYLRADTSQAGRTRNEDLSIASTLILNATGEGSEDQLSAAAQALRRFDGLIARSVLDNDALANLMRAEAALYADILSESVSDIRRSVQSDDHKIFNRARTDRYYRIMGKIYAVGTLLNAVQTDDIVQPGFRDAREKARSALARAFAPRPLIVSNPQPGDFSLGGNDMMTLAYLIEDAIFALRELEAVLEENHLASATDIRDRS